MIPEDAIDVVVALIPNWYYAARGPYSNEISLHGVTKTFYSQRGLTPLLKRFHDRINGDLDAVVAAVRGFGDAVALELVQQHFALAWLELNAPGVAWSRLLDWDRQLSNRTYENVAI